MKRLGKNSLTLQRCYNDREENGAFSYSSHDGIHDAQPTSATLALVFIHCQ